VQSEDVAQDEVGELARWQDLMSGREGQGGGFGLLRNGLTPEPKLRMSCVSATALCGSALELSDSCGMALLQLPASAVEVEKDT
jgi:hypothetical protein